MLSSACSGFDEEVLVGRSLAGGYVSCRLLVLSSVEVTADDG